MATSYADFQTYVLRTLWRVGDADLTSDLPRLIREAEARMSRDLRIEDNTTIFEHTFESNEVALPADYQEIRSVDFEPWGTAAYITPQQYAKKLVDNRDNIQPPPFYTVMTKRLLLLGNIGVDSSVDVSVLYYTKLPPFEDNTDLNQFYEDYPDMYLAAVLQRTYVYMRDTEKAGIFEQQYANLAQSVMDNEGSRKYAGAPIHMGLPGIVA